MMMIHFFREQLNTLFKLEYIPTIQRQNYWIFLWKKARITIVMDTTDQGAQSLTLCPSSYLHVFAQVFECGVFCEGIP